MKAHRYRPTWTATARFLRGRKNRTFLFLISLRHPEPARPSAAWLEQGTEQIIGLSISSREYDRAIRIMESGISDYFAKNHLVLPEGWESELHLEMGYRQGGYGQYDERILQVIREEFCRNGLPLDPTYTGKAFWGMKQYIEEHQLQDCDVLFIHTGGTPLFYDCILNDTDGGKK